MIIGGESPKWFVIIFAASLVGFSSPSPLCELGYSAGNKLYNFSLAAPLPKFPHGILSEDGFYKVTANETVLWFQVGSYQRVEGGVLGRMIIQLCDGMIFNHDPPVCVECLGCGGASRCGMGCSALIANNAGGYQVCTTIGHVASTYVMINDEKHPQKGVTVRMSNTGQKNNCSLTVSIFCDTMSFQGPNSMEILGDCNFATSLRHPAACATIITNQGGSLGWFGSLMITVICLFGAYFLAGIVYRYFFLGIRGAEIIPNLELWATIPHRTQSFSSSLIRRFRGRSEGHRSSYSPINF